MTLNTRIPGMVPCSPFKMTIRSPPIWSQKINPPFKLQDPTPSWPPITQPCCPACHLSPVRTGGNWRALCSLTECELPANVLVHTHPVGPVPQAGQEVLEGRRLRPALYHHWHTCPVPQRCWEAEQSIKTKETCVRMPALLREEVCVRAVHRACKTGSLFCSPL